MSNNNSMAKLYDKVKFFDNVKIIPGGIVTPSEPPAPAVPLYALTRSVASTDEGTTVTFTLSTAHVANGTAVPYVINGISEQDLIAGSLTGSFVVNAGSSVLSFTIAEDTLTEGTETLTLSAANKTASVSILDTSREPIYIVDPGLDYKLSRSVASANEGSVVAYTLSSWFFGQGDVVPYTIGGISQDDLLAGSLTGSFVFGNTNTATLSFAIATDLLTEGSEVMTLSAIEKASSITINDTSTTPEYPAAYKLTRDVASANEGNTVTFTLSTVNVPEGTVIPWKVTGITQSDISASSSGLLEGSFVIDSNSISSATFVLSEDLLTEGTEVMTISAAGKTSSISVWDTSLSPQYTIVRSATATDEGTTVTYTLSSNAAPDYTLVPYTITGINAADLSSGSLAGNFEVVSQTASVSFTLANDLRMEGPETMTISAGSRTSSILINDTSANPLYALSRSAASANEGTTVTYTLSTARVGEGAQVPYKITGLSAEDLSSGLLEGAFVVDGAGFATLSLTLANDQLTEGTETMTLSAGNRTSAISVLDTSKAPVYTITRSAATVSEGTMITYRLSAAFVEVGTAVPYVITGISQEDLSFGSLEGNFVLGSSNTDTISATLAVDLLTEGTETMTITVADKSSSITVNDTSTTPEVVLLLAGDGEEGANNNTFVDSSSNNLYVTSVGSPSAVQTSPFDDGGKSAYFDGNDYFNLGRPVLNTTGNFTIECWIYVAGGSGTMRNIIGQYLDGDSNRTNFAIRTNNRLSWSTVGSSIQLTSNDIIPTNTWTHVAIVRSGSSTNNVSMYVNGVVQNSYTDNGNFAQTNTWIGQGQSHSSGAFVGYISNLRITNSDVYTSNFSVPTAPLTNISNTIFLLDITEPGVVDSSSKNPLIYTRGNSKITTSVKKYGTGSLAFDGTGDYLQIPASSNFNFGVADFTVELWVMLNGASSSGSRIFQTANGDIYTGINIQETNGKVLFYCSTNGSTWGASDTIGADINNGTWNHIALVRSASGINFYVNGVSIKIVAVSPSASLYYNNTDIIVGGQASGRHLNGYIDDLRITKGAALYTSNFTPPTGPLTINI